MQLSRKQMDAVLVAHHRIHPDRQDTFKSRIKTLQRMGFPPGTNVGRGPKMSYSADHLMMLVTVIEFQQMGLPAERAISTVLSDWNDLKVGYGVAFDLNDQFGLGGEKILGWIFGRGLRELQFPPDTPFGPARTRSAQVLTSSAFLERLTTHSSDRTSYNYILLDLSDILLSVRSACVNSGGITDTDFSDEFNLWSEHRGGYVRGGHPLRRKPV